MIKIDKEVQVRKSFSFSWSGIGLDFIRSAILPINQTGSPGPVFQNSVADPPDIFCSPIDCLHTCSRTKIFPCFKYVLSSSPHFSNQTLFNFNHFSYSFLLCMMDCLNGLLSSHIWKLTSEKYFRSKWKVYDLAIMVLSSCCGVGSLRTGTLIIGALNLVLALLVLPLGVWCASDPSVSARISLCKICCNRFIIVWLCPIQATKS